MTNKANEAADSVNAKPTADDADDADGPLPRTPEQVLLAQINMAIQLATTAFNHALNWPNATSIAAVDRAIDLLTFFNAQAQKLKDSGQAAAHQLLTTVLADLTAGRGKLAPNVRQMNVNQLAETKREADERAKAEEKRRKQHEADLAAFEARQKEGRKLL